MDMRQRLTCPLGRAALLMQRRVRNASARAQPRGHRIAEGAVLHCVSPASTGNSPDTPKRKTRTFLVRWVWALGTSRIDPVLLGTRHKKLRGVRLR
ncbi:hypothetical protein [Nocardia pneumoniae]|uniref:hypothetical protein n=1 Tax=Nocardia pneumoniae TaxID=228601 RepID=UPI00031FD451|nr:hypothetical protein [Nocardia pneumoniae]